MELVQEDPSASRFRARMPAEIAIGSTTVEEYRAEYGPPAMLADEPAAPIELPDPQWEYWKALEDISYGNGPPPLEEIHSPDFRFKIMTAILNSTELKIPTVPEIMPENFPTVPLIEERMAHEAQYIFGEGLVGGKAMFAQICKDYQKSRAPSHENAARPADEMETN